MIEELKSKTQPVSKEQVWSAWKRIRKGGQGLGIDQIGIDEIDTNPRKYLYPLWNRLASGSYFPPPVKEVLIPKGKVKKRMLGVPTILDKVAQEVIRAELEKTVEPRFHPSSFGYRPGKSAHDAVEQCAKNCWERWYVVANDLAPKIRGWIYYYGRFRLSEMQWVFRLLNVRIAKWARKKYKLCTYAKSYGWLKRMVKWYPNTFVHWIYGFTD